MAAPAPVAQQFIIHPPAGSKSLQPNRDLNQPLYQTSDEGWRSIMKMFNPDAVWLDKITRLLYSATLVKTNTTDKSSPLSGYTLQDITADGTGKPIRNINYEGYITYANNFILFCSEVHSTTHAEPKEVSPLISAIDDTFALIDMLTANWEAWGYTNELLTVPLGLATFEGIYFTRRRSVGGNFLAKLFRAFSPSPNQEPMDEKPRVKFPTIG